MGFYRGIISIMTLHTWPTQEYGTMMLPLLHKALHFTYGMRTAKKSGKNTGILYRFYRFHITVLSKALRRIHVL